MWLKGLFALVLSLWLSSSSCYCQLLGCVDPPGIVVTPSTNQTVPINSNIIVTYRCNVDSGRQANWVVADIQAPVMSSRRDVFADRGINITAGSNDSEVFIAVTRAGRETFSNADLPIACYALDTADVGITTGCTYYVRTFNPPGIPPALNFNPYPGNLSRLVLTWDQPSNTLIDTGDPVVTTYTVTVSGPTFNFTADTTDTRYEIVDNPDDPCAEHTFSVHASNQAGTGPADVINETIPISPDIRNLSAQLIVSRISLATPISIEVTFPQAIACSSNFPLSSYFVHIEGRATFSFSPTDPAIAGRELITLSVEDGLAPNELYSLSVSACISVTCRQSQAVTFMTTDVQSARIVYYENNIYLSCSFASSSSALGCVFIFTAPSNITEEFRVSQSGSGFCAQLQNMRNVYTSIVVLDWELDGSYGNRPIIPAENRSIAAEEFMQLTGCSLPTDPPVRTVPVTVPVPVELSGGAIAGIVVGVIVVVVIAGVIIAIIIWLIVRRYRRKVGDAQTDGVVVDCSNEFDTLLGQGGTDCTDGLDSNPAYVQGGRPPKGEFELELGRGRKSGKVVIDQNMLNKLSRMMTESGKSKVEYKFLVP